MKKKLFVATLLAIVITFQFCNSPVEKSTEKSQWRGENRDGIFNETNLLSEWPEEGPELLWKFEDLGIGYTSAIVSSDKVYITGINDSIGNLFAFDYSGNLLWKKEYGPDWMVNFPGTRTSPIIYGEHGYLLSGYGELICFNAQKGDIIWTKNILNEYEGVNPEQGITENLIIEGDKLFCTPGGPEKNIVALNRLTGEEIWTSKGNGEKSAFCSPQLIEFNGKKFFITMTAKTILSIDIENGNLAWKRSDLIYQYPDHPNTPIYKDGYLFYIDGEKGGSTLLKLTNFGYSVEEVYKSDIIDQVLGNAILLDGKLYSYSKNRKEWVCVDWMSGDLNYSSDLLSEGSIISADGLLYCYAFSGEFALLKPMNNGFEKKGSFKVQCEKRDHWAHPVIRDGKLFIRYDKNLWVYNIKEK